MRNADRIRELEREVGRYCKKILDQGRELEALRKETEELRAGSGEVQRAVDALLTAVTLRYGEREKELGWRLNVPGVDVEDLLGRYEIHARRGDEGYVIGVVEREETPLGGAPSSVSPSGCHLPPEGKA